LGYPQKIQGLGRVQQRGGGSSSGLVSWSFGGRVGYLGQPFLDTTFNGKMNPDTNGTG